MIAPARAKPASLELSEIRKVYGDAVVLNGVSLDVAPGEIVCLLGQSGCGKTTLLRIAAGLERQTAGRVVLAGWEVAGPDRFIQPEARGVGLMFQDYALFPHLTILQNVMFGLQSLPQVRAQEIAGSALQRVGLAYHAGDYPHMLSGGEQQRAALARALAPQPGILLMDEPFSNLDQRMREQIREETIGLLREKDTTAVVVTHDPVEAMMIADRIVLMRAGRVVQCGTPEELYNRPATLFAARFFCEFNELEGVAREGHVECRLGRFPAPGVRNGAAVVCLRPQAIEVGPANTSEGGAEEDGTVLSSRFLGETQRLLVEVEGLEQPLHLSLASPGRRFEPGQRVGLRIDRDRVLTFAAKCSSQPG